MKLKRLSDRIWYYPYEELRDRPNLGYIKGDIFSVAVDAGHSASHTEEFYRALAEEGLPLPTLTIITHWHWDHTFGMHSVNGLCIANSKTKQHLSEIRDKLRKEGTAGFINMHDSIRREYSDDKPVIITLPEIVFDKELLIDAGNCPIRLINSQSPHTDDSTLVYVIDEKALFIGDSNSGEFPGGSKRRDLCEELVKTISSIGAEICLEGHWTPDTPDGIIKDILN